MTLSDKRREALHVAHLGSDMEPRAACNIFKKISSQEGGIASRRDVFLEPTWSVIAYTALQIGGQRAGGAYLHNPT